MDKKAQAAIELAIFGAILIFILGAIVRSVVSSGYSQDENFKAMRMAMLASWQGSKAHPGRGAAQDLSHNSASILFVEDRLSPDFNKYGDLERNPFIAQGAGTFSYNLQYPVDQGEVSANVPIMDVYINGQHFPFTTASYTTTTLSRPVCSASGPYKTYPLSRSRCLQNQCLRNAREWSGGSKLFYVRVPNGGNFASLGGISVPNGTLTFTFNPNASDDMFDLQRLGDLSSSNPSYVTAASGLRPYIAWQWASVAATSASAIGLNAKNYQYPTYDIDGRLKEVVIYNISGSTVTYEDPDGGDIDGLWDANSCAPRPGLQQKSQIYTFTKDGTYLQIKEGKLYNPEDHQYVRSANKRNTIDLIQRTIQLSNNTGRFCSGGQRCSGANCANPNPVEVCIAAGSGDNCFSNETNIKSTCYDENSNRIFVRSRLKDLRGHFWMTDTSGQMSIK